MLKTPSFAEERDLQERGYRFVAGIDEAGRGPLAGPVVAAAVILPCPLAAPWLSQVRDSKQLLPARRESLFQYIQETAIAIGVGTVPHDVIDHRGIVHATRLAMQQAIERLSPPADYLLIDYLRLPGVPIPQKAITNGDTLCFSIACASIVAKVTRDRLMRETDSIYPGYGFAQHKGYGTRKHLACLRRLGPSPVHRRSFRPVKELSYRQYRRTPSAEATV
ncbi:MAG TPA: ribonuclease HII [Dehalococcoidia bacterium]|nr:ribonuclease HII [Dehalococcoidia bacterium]